MEFQNPVAVRHMHIASFMYLAALSNFYYHDCISYCYFIFQHASYFYEKMQDCNVVTTPYILIHVVKVNSISHHNSEDYNNKNVVQANDTIMCFICSPRVWQ